MPVPQGIRLGFGVKLVADVKLYGKPGWRNWQTHGT